MMKKKMITIMTPCFNEEASVLECYKKVREVFDTKLTNYTYEHIFIDNSSTDRSVAILKEITAKDKNIKLIVNSRNFGPHNSPYYGILQMSGDAIVPIVADLQTPPELIVDFVKKWEEGYNIVIAVRTGMEEGFFLRLARNTFYKIISRLSHIEQLKHFIGFGLFDKSIIDVLRGIDDPCPYFRGLISEVGFEKAYVKYHQPPRMHSKSKNSFFDLFEYAITGISSYSKVPLRLTTILGFTTSILSLSAAAIYLFLKLFFWRAFPMGIAPIMISIFFFASIQLLCVGIVGEYIGMIFEHIKKRPLVIEKERINFD